MSDRPVSVRTGAVPYTVSIHDGLHTWSGDTQLANGGGDAGPDPESQVLGALGACTAITVSMVAARKQWPLTAVHVHLHYTQCGAAGTAIAREVVLDGALDDEQRARLMEVADKCPIHRLLTGEVRIQTRLQAAGGGGDTAIGATDRRLPAVLEYGECEIGIGTGDRSAPIPGVRRGEPLLQRAQP